MTVKNREWRLTVRFINVPKGVLKKASKDRRWSMNDFIEEAVLNALADLAAKE